MLDTDLRSKVTWRDYSVLARDQCNITIRVYRTNKYLDVTPLPVYLYFHGGGYLFGTSETEDAACARVADGAGILVASVGYRHTPEFTHPTQVNDALDSFTWLVDNIDTIGGDRNRVIVGGISAGACLAAVVAQQSRTTGTGVTICGQLLCIPWLVHPDNNPSNTTAAPLTSSYQQNTHADVLPLGLLQLFTKLLSASGPGDPTLNPGLADDTVVAGLPKTCFLVAGQDLLRDEGLSYARKLDKNGYVSSPRLDNKEKKYCRTTANLDSPLFSHTEYRSRYMSSLGCPMGFAATRTCALATAGMSCWWKAASGFCRALAPLLVVSFWRSRSNVSTEH